MRNYAVDLLKAIVDADDSKRAANESGQHASPISRWIPLEEAIEAARQYLKDTATNQDDIDAHRDLDDIPANRGGNRMQTWSDVG